MSKSDADRELALVKRAAAQLAEHFDTVQIFVTRVSGEAGGTININSGQGNWFARYGQVQFWLSKETPASAADNGAYPPDDDE